MRRLLRAVGGSIRSVRKARHLSQEELAEKSGLHPNYIGGVERGERNVSLNNLAKIAKGLNVPLHQIFVNIEAETSEDRELLSVISVADATTVRLINRIAKEIEEWRKAEMSLKAEDNRR